MRSLTTPAAGFRQARDRARRILIERAAGLVRGGSNTRAACRRVGLLGSRAECAVKALCDARGVARRRNPQPVKFQTDNPWPVRIAPRKP